MKRLVFMSFNLDYGGIERSLLSILSNIDYKKYKVDLYLQERSGVFLSEIPKEVNIIEYSVSKNNNKILRKIINRLKLIKTCFLNYNKYDFSVSFATSIIPFSILARYFSKNNYIFVHTDYYQYYGKDIHKMDVFFRGINLFKFKNIVFVSNESRDNFLNIYKTITANIIVCNNIIDDRLIKEKSLDTIDYKKEYTTFLNVSRHYEHSKRITRLIEAVKLLVIDGYKFKLLLVGDGEDNKLYRNLVLKNNLEDYIIFTGAQKNPYPYFKEADCFVLSSDYEGFPVVYLESLIFDLPIITTINVSDDMIKIKDKYGMIADKSSESLYLCMKEFLNNGYKMEENFDIKLYNQSILKKLNNLYDKEDN